MAGPVKTEAVVLEDAVAFFSQHIKTNPNDAAAYASRATVWQLVENLPRNKFEVLFGFGLSNNSFNGLAIDSNWLATYNDQGLFGIALCVALLVFLIVLAYFRPRGLHRALALFLVTYCLIASYTETGLSQPSSYLLDMALAASLLMVPLPGKRPAPALPPLLGPSQRRLSLPGKRPG